MTDDSPRIRLRVIGVVSFSLLVALVARLWFLQILNADAYEQRAIANAERVVKVDTSRGRIFDRNGKLLVDNRVVTTVSIDKAEFERAFGGKSKTAQRTEVLTRLAVEISKSGELTKVDDIERRMRNSQYSRIGEVPVAVDVDDYLMVLVGEHPEQFPGVDVGQTTVRDYPYGELAAHVLGYVGPINDSEYQSKAASPKRYDLNDEIGKAGLEQLFEDVLRGTPGTKVYEVDRNERVIQELGDREVEPVPGQDIHLTIDIGLQNLVEVELRDALAEARLQERKPGDPEITAPAGAAVVLDPQNGSVLAMASNPTYSPSDFIKGISGGVREAQRSRQLQPDPQPRHPRRVRAGLDVQAVHCVRRDRERLHGSRKAAVGVQACERHGLRSRRCLPADAVRRRQVQVGEREGRQRVSARVQRRRSADGAHGVERHLLLRDRRRDRAQRWRTTTRSRTPRRRSGSGRRPRCSFRPSGPVGWGQA